MNVAIFGFGAMGQYATRMLLDKGCRVIAVIDPAADLEQRIDQVFAADEARPLLFHACPELTSLNLDLALHTFATHLGQIEEVALVCAGAGINVASIAEDAFEPFFADQDLPIALRLDAAFKQAKRCFIASGVQDNFLYQIPLALVQASNRVTRITIANMADLSKMGPAVLEHLPIGAAPEECRDITDSPITQRVCFDIAARPLIRRLGRRIERVHNQIRLVVAEQPIACASLNLHIAAGKVCGIEELTRIELDDGCLLELSLQAVIPAEGQSAFYRCEVTCEAPTTLTVQPFDGAMVTCSALVNRALGLRNAPHGFISVDQL